MRIKLFIAIALLSAGASHAASTVALYDFNNSFVPLAGFGLGTAQPLVPVNPLGTSSFELANVNGIERTVYRFNGAASPPLNQGGLQFVSGDLMNANSYSVEMYFSFDQVSGWRRILDTRDRSEDTGFYVLNGGLQLYPSNVGQGSFLANTYYHVILSFNGSQAVAYLNGAAQSTQNTDYYALPASNVISLFLDNVAGPAQTEYSAGRIAWARFYDGALNAAQAQEAYEQAIGFTPVIPEPGTWAMLLAGLAGLAGLQRLRGPLPRP